MKNALTLFGVLLLGMGLVFAIAGTSVTYVTDYGRWTEGVAGNWTTEGGNITALNLSQTDLTDRWAAFLGNVSGGIVLQDAAANLFYDWTYTAGSAGEVCATTGSDFAWATVSDTTGALVNAGFTLGNAADNATGTLVDASACNLDFIEGDVANSAYVAHEGTSNFWTCAVDDGGAAQGDFAFCTNITSDTDYRGGTSNYEIMVPTTPGEVETYYFFAELE